MTMALRIETALEAALARAETPAAPPRLAAAMRHAVFPGGARVRPQLCLAVSLACGDGDPTLAEAFATAIELLHCASLAHDDLPCFDDAAIRRGRPSVHSAFSPALAVLAGDALIVMAFDVLVRAGAARPAKLAPLLACRQESSRARGGRASPSRPWTFITAPRPERFSWPRSWAAP